MDIEKRIKEIEKQIDALEKELKELKLQQKPYTLKRTVSIYRNGKRFATKENVSHHAQKESTLLTIKRFNGCMKVRSLSRNYATIRIDYVVELYNKPTWSNTVVFENGKEVKIEGREEDGNL